MRHFKQAFQVIRQYPYHAGSLKLNRRRYRMLEQIRKIKQIFKKIFMPQATKEDEGFSKIAEQIADRHNKYGVTLTDPRTGEDLLAGMGDEGYLTCFVSTAKAYRKTLKIILRTFNSGSL